MDNFNYQKSHTSYYMNKIDDVIKWFSENNLNAHGSRYRRYKNHIDNFYKTINFSDLDKNFMKLNYAFVECVEIVTVYDAFKDDKSKGFYDRLGMVINGRDFFEEGQTSDQPRDYLYELVVASTFKEKGYKIDFDTATDVIAFKDDVKIFIECKRLKSVKRLEENLRKASKQLKSNIDSESYGLIFMDITNCLTETLKTYEYSSDTEMRSFVKDAYNDFYSPCSKKINDILVSENNVSLGVCFSLSKCLWLSNVKPQFYRDTRVIAPSSISDDDFDKLKQILK